MAHYYYCYNNHTDPSEYNQNYFVPQDYEPSIYNLFDYNPTPYNYNNNNNNNIQQNSSIITTAYSTFTPTEPKSVQHCYYQEPNSYQIVTDRTFYSQTAAAKSSTAEFDPPDFDEYDPTPYGGGYDIVQTYGRPLPPSDQICYSRGGGGGSTAPPPLPPPSLPPPPPVKRKEEEEEEEKRQEEESCEKEVVSQIPSGYGLEATDLFGSLFGHWPSYYAGRGNDNDSGGYYCERNAGRLDNGGGVIGCGGYQDGGAADYLFGTLDPYVERRDGGGSFGLPIHCYDRHFREQALSIVQADDDQLYDYHQHCYRDEDNSWGIF